MNTSPSRRRFLAGSLPLAVTTVALSGINIANARKGMTDQELVDHHFTELAAALRRLHPEITELKRLPENGCLKFGILAFATQAA